MTPVLERPPATADPSVAVEDALALALAARAIGRVAADPFFVGHTLAVCKERFGIDEPALARFLGCPASGLIRLALSAQPDPAIPGYCARLKRIAGATGADLAMLMALIELSGRAEGSAG